MKEYRDGMINTRMGAGEIFVRAIREAHIAPIVLRIGRGDPVEERLTVDDTLRLIDLLQRQLDWVYQ